jgi:hypothetical protein
MESAGDCGEGGRRGY